MTVPASTASETTLQCPNFGSPGCEKVATLIPGVGRRLGIGLAAGKIPLALIEQLSSKTLAERKAAQIGTLKVSVCAACDRICAICSPLFIPYEGGVCAFPFSREEVVADLIAKNPPIFEPQVLGVITQEAESASFNPFA